LFHYLVIPGESLTPSVVYYETPLNWDTGKPIVGNYAVEMQLSNPEDVVYGLKNANAHFI
jgi:molecular chaperone DnaK (HSP70)